MGAVELLPYDCHASDSSLKLFSRWTRANKSTVKWLFDSTLGIWCVVTWLRYPFCSAHCSAPCSALAGALSVARPTLCARCENNMIANISAQTALICLYIIVYKSCCVTLFLFCLLDLEWAKLWQQIHQGNHLNYLPLEDIVSKFFTNILILMLFRHQWQQVTNYTVASQQIRMSSKSWPKLPLFNLEKWNSLYRFVTCRLLCFKCLFLWILMIIVDENPTFFVSKTD